ncbi:MAG: hypothetical protein CFE45_03530 [Burkholderiales bacterium PBB5]|nr:MAG: hypothetical protein CFE45_03530 [Burkholderiales bacterium PBB5]
MRLFDQPSTGGELCTARLLRGLAQAGHDVTVIGRGQGPRQELARMRYLSLGGGVPAFDDMPLPRRLYIPLAALANGRPISTQRLHSLGTARQVQRHLSRMSDGLDALVVDHLQALDWVTPALPWLPAPMVVMHNLEADGLQHGSVIACLSGRDALRMRELAAQRHRTPSVVVLPGYALPPAPPDTRPPAASRGLSPQAVAQALAQLPAGARRIGMIGTWTWEPNRAGLQWMLEQVHPLLPEHCHLVLAGSGLDGVALPPRTVALGRIDTVDSLYRAVDVVAIPSWRGSGVHEKAIEAIGAGLTVVATPHALRGLESNLPQRVHTASDAAGFAQACATAPAAGPGPDATAGQAWSLQRSQDYRDMLHRCLALAARGRQGEPVNAPLSAT